MTDDELEVWRRQWHSQPAVPIRFDPQGGAGDRAHANPSDRTNCACIVGVGTVIAAAIMQTLTWILLAIGTWLFILIGWFFMVQNTKGIWGPTADTTAAYVELSIELYLALGSDLDIGWFQIAMNNLARVRRFQSLGNLTC